MDHEPWIINEKYYLEKSDKVILIIQIHLTKINLINLYKRFINIFSKKDPLLQALLFENAITFTSTMVPIVC